MEILRLQKEFKKLKEANTAIEQYTMETNQINQLRRDENLKLKEELMMERELSQLAVSPSGS